MFSNTLCNGVSVACPFLSGFSQVANFSVLYPTRVKIERSDDTAPFIAKGKASIKVQRPVKRAYKQDEEKVKNWVELEFPGITARAKEEEAEIYFGDETGLQNQPTCLRGYAPIGQTPVVRTESKHIKINMLSAISNRGKLRFVLYKDNMDADKLIDFMRRLFHDSKKKVFLVLDNLRVHHAKKVTAWLEKHKDEIEVFYLPPYAPEYNPDELLNSDLKRAISKRPSPRSDGELEHNVRSHLKSAQLKPDKVKGFFSSPTASYAF